MKMMKLWMLIVVAAMASACSKQDAEEFNPADNTLKTIQFTATGVGGGRTAFGDYDSTNNTYPTLWQEGDRVKINANFATTDGTKIMVLNNGDSPVVTPIDGGTSAAFSLTMNDLNGTLYEAEEYTFYAACYPDTWMHSGGATDGKIRMAIPGTQTPAVGSCDPKAQALFAKSATVTDLSQPIALNFKHATAYGCMTLKNVPEAFTSVVISTDAIISYRCYYDFNANEGEEISFSSSDQKASTIQDKKSNMITLNTSLNEVWFAMIPADLSGKALTIRVNLNDGSYYEKTITFANGDGNFESGKIAKFSVNFADVAKVVPAEPFQLLEVYKENDVAQGVVF